MVAEFAFVPAARRALASWADFDKLTAERPAGPRGEVRTCTREGREREGERAGRIRAE